MTTTTISLIQWMSQTTRLQAFVMLSCLVILVESFIIPSHPMHRKVVVVAFHFGEEDMSWNNTANAMNAARTTISSSTTSLPASTTVATPDTTTFESPSTPRFEPTVTYSTLDHWFHVLGGMEEERTSGKISSRNRQHSHEDKKHPFPPTAAPTIGIPESNNNNHNNKPTDYWML